MEKEPTLLTEILNGLMSGEITLDGAYQAAMQGLILEEFDEVVERLRRIFCEQ